MAACNLCLSSPLKPFAWFAILSSCDVWIEAPGASLEGLRSQDGGHSCATEAHPLCALQEVQCKELRLESLTPEEFVEHLSEKVAWICWNSCVVQVLMRCSGNHLASNLESIWPCCPKEVDRILYAVCATTCPLDPCPSWLKASRWWPASGFTQ